MGLASIAKQAFAEAMGGIADDALRAAIRRSSGKLSDRTRKRRPFATRHGRALVDPSRINVGTGAFRRDWESSSGADSAQLRNDNPVTDFFGGTKTMLTRPIQSALEQDLIVPIDRRMADAKRKIERSV